MYLYNICFNTWTLYLHNLRLYVNNRKLVEGYKKVKKSIWVSSMEGVEFLNRDDDVWFFYVLEKIKANFLCSKCL